MQCTQRFYLFSQVTHTVHAMYARATVHGMHGKFWEPEAVATCTRRLLDLTGMSGVALATLAGVAPSQLSRWSRGTTRPRQATLARLRRELAEHGYGADVDAVVADLTRAAGYPAESTTARHLAELTAEEIASIRALGLPDDDTELLIDIRRSQIAQLQEVIDRMRSRRAGNDQ